MNAVVILGPTGIGKSKLSVPLAERLNAEIVCVDSRTVYKGLDIGTAKPSPEDLKKIPHHLIDILDLSERCDAAWFSRQARNAMEEIESRGRIPILVGGSGLYLKAALQGLFEIELDEEERRDFSKRISAVTTGELYSSLSKVDEESAGRINRNDRQRIARALEIYELSGIPLSEHFRRHNKEGGYGVDALKIGLNTDRSILHAMIDERTKRMFDAGWAEEVSELLSRGADPAWPGMKTLGYPEIVDLIEGKSGFEVTLERIRARTRQYAKRQLTWFRKERGVHWIDPSSSEVIKEAIKILDRKMEN